MARDHAGTTLYRAVIVRETANGQGKTTDVVGPYLNEHTARAQITRQSRWFKVIESRVEIARPEWEPVT